MLEDYPLMVMTDRSGNPVVTRVGVPVDEQALISCIDSSGNPLVSAVDIGFIGTEMQTSNDKNGIGLAVVPPRVMVGSPAFALDPTGNCTDDWKCNSFSDNFNRGDGPIRSMPDFPWLGTGVKIVSQKACKVTGALATWGENTWYPAYSTMKTYPVGPYGTFRSWEWLLIINQGAGPATSTAYVNVRTFDDSGQPIYLFLRLGWNALTSNSGLIVIFNGYVNIPSVLNGKVISWKVNAKGYQSVSYFGRTHTHQF